jgi:hypothetical protein
MKASPIILVIANIASSSILPRGERLEAGPAPQGCKRIKTDVDFPAFAVVQTVLPGVIVEKRRAGKTSPNYRFAPKTIEEVQKAIKFVGKINIWNAIISTG